MTQPDPSPDGEDSSFMKYFFAVVVVLAMIYTIAAITRTIKSRAEDFDRIEQGIQQTDQVDGTKSQR